MSLDLDDRWTYLRTHGDPDWESAATYLPLVVDRVLGVLADRGLEITWFLVGRDTEDAAKRVAMAAISAAGHEIGNHSWSHLPWLHLMDREELASEIDRSREAIEAVTGKEARGFRGPGYSLSIATLEHLSATGVLYDASTLPTWIGPLARRYYLASSNLEGPEREQRARLFGRWSDGRRPNRPYRWKLEEPAEASAGRLDLIELPVTTYPLLRTPIHLSYLIWLRRFGSAAPFLYFRGALRLCRLLRVEPSFLLHPLDFLGPDEAPELSFFPGMHLDRDAKLALVGELLDLFSEHFAPEPMARRAESWSSEPTLAERRPTS